MNKDFFDIPQAEINRLVAKNYGKRQNMETGFRVVALAAIFSALAVLLVLLGSTAWTAKGALFQSEILLEVVMDEQSLGVDYDNINKGNFGGAIKASLREQFSNVKKRKDKKLLYDLISETAAFELLQKLRDKPELYGQRLSVWLLASDTADAYLKSSPSRIEDSQKIWLQALQENDQVRRIFNYRFFISGDSRSPEAAGIAGALIGSAWMILVTLILAFPLGVMAAVYLQEFAPKNRFNDFIEININTLASVPSIVFGLLGFVAFIEFFGMPRSAPVTGGMVLALMTLPVIIIATRSSLQTIPPSIREGALAMGASRMQMILHHVLPLSLPGILTGSIIGISRALGETAPLLMIGMNAFTIGVPESMTSASSALPSQIYLWADNPERAFLERTALAILVLLALLIAVNSVAVILRRRFMQKW